MCAVVQQKLSKLSVHLFLLAGIGLYGTSVLGQTTMPDGWQSLPLEEFISAAESLLGDGNATTELVQEVAAHASQLLVETDAVEAAGSYADIASLLRIAQGAISGEQKAALLTRIQRREEPVSMPYLELRTKVAAMYLAGATYADRSQLVADWVAQAEPEDFDTIWEGEWPWLYNQLSYPLASDSNVNVTWTGKVRIPNSGEYTFSVSPIDVNVVTNRFVLIQAMTVTVNGKEVVTASEKAWVHEGTPVSFAANQLIDIKVEYVCDCYTPPVDVMHAMLMWEGPGITKQLIPESQLFLADGTSPGLNAVYKLKLGSDQTSTVPRVDSTIDFCWTTGRRIVPQYSESQKKVKEYLYPRCVSDSYLAACESGDANGKSHPFLHEPRLMAECLSSPERAGFTRAVVDRPALLAPMTFQEIFEFYRAFRIGALDESLDMLASWCLLNRDLTCQVEGTTTSPENFFRTNRLVARELAIAVGLRYPQHHEQLKSGHLETTDGSCCLPVAYTLAYSHLIRDEIQAWIDLLDSKLSDETLAGDARVNWLVARAMAEEVRIDPTGWHTTHWGRLAAGNGWLQEAMLISESESTRLRVLGEIVTRQAALGQKDQALERLDSERDSFSDQVSVETLGNWRASLLALSQTRIQQQEQAAEAARDAYLAELRRRQQLAASRGNSSSAERYSARIEQLESR